MAEKAGRNDPCPCGSGKKYKQCCWQRDNTPPQKKKFTAKVISGGEVKQEVPSKGSSFRGVDLMEKTFGQAIQKADSEGKPPISSNPGEYLEEKNS
jgi:uncharacterized protein